MTPAIARTMLYVAVAGWGVTFVANHELLVALEPFQIVVLRFIGVSASFLVFLWLVPSMRPRLSGRDWRWLGLGGLLAVPMAQGLAVAGQQYLPPSMAGLVATSTPALAAVLAYRFLGERLVPRQIFGIVVALCGVSIVVVFASGTGTDLIVRNPWGAALFILSQVAWAGYTVLGRSLAVRHQPLTMVTTAFLLGSIMLLPWLPYALGGISSLTTVQWWWLAHLVVGGTLIPHVTWFVALRYLTANDTVLSMYLVPLYATLFSVVLLGERLTVVGLLGGAAILAGVTLSQARRTRPTV